MKSRGHVYLVGAGPGPADLLTVRAQRLLRRADVVAYDDLVHPSLLQLVKGGCELLAVGYRAGDQAHRPPPLHPAVLERAQAGLSVVRLKSGDPMIFARGGEEAEALAAAGIHFSVVPGITAALAAASAFHLPLTWRGQACELRISTQGAKIAPPDARCTWALYMPRQGIEAFAADLLHAGWSAATPAAFIIAAAHSQQRCIRSSLAELAQAVAAHPSPLPGIVLVGDSLRAELPQQLRRESLTGSRILIARAHADPSRLASLLRRRGADVWEAPVIQSLPQSSAGLDLAALLRAQDFLLVPSRSAWQGFIALMREHGIDARQLPSLISIGAVRRDLEKLHLHPAVHLQTRQRLPPTWSYGQRGLILSAAEEGEELAAQLRALGVEASSLLVAHWHIQYPRLPVPTPDLIVVPHLKSLERLFTHEPYRLQLQARPCLALGSRIAEALRERGCQQVITAAAGPLAGILPLIEDWWHASHTWKEYDGQHGAFDSLYGSR